VSNPARSYAQAIDRAKAFMARDGANVLPQARTALLEHGATAPLAVVLFHGLTNNPAQYEQFAPELYDRGVNVFVPRMPDHGDRDRLTSALATLTAEELIASATEAVDIACGLGQRVGILGISMGGLLTAYFAQFRDVTVAVPVAPSFALLHLPYPISRAVAAVGRWLPNRFLWWDPRVRASELPITAYPRFPTHALMQTLRVGDAVYAAARRRPPLAARIVAVVNRADPAVNNAVTRGVVAAWSLRKKHVAEYVELTDLPLCHDIIDPQQPLARTDLVYPKLLDALGITSRQMQPRPAN
jgi:alpha-beta hydrolase superfamily lysophospholipase